MTGDSAKRLVIFGAGAVGRGFIGEIFSDAGWIVSFLDVQPALIEALQRDGSYRHRTVGTGEKIKTVAPVEAGFSTDRDHVLAEIEAATCVATSVGARVLPLIAPVLRDALLNRYASGAGPLDILLCENLHGAGPIMLELLTSGLTDEDAQRLAGRTGLIETSIGRMIPATQTSGQSVTDVAVEPYRFLPVDIAAARTGVLESVPGIVVDREVDFSFYGDRKLYVHNMGHFLCALLGQQAGFSEIWEAVQEPTVRYLTRAAMIESALALSARYSYPICGLIDHVDDLLHRFENRALGDSIERVARDPQRKMEPDDRMLGAYRAALSAGVPAAHLALALAAGALAWEKTGDVSAHDIEAHIARALREHPQAIALPISLWAALRSGDGVAASMRILAHRFDPPSIP